MNNFLENKKLVIDAQNFTCKIFNINVVKEGDNIWFKGKNVALALGYKNQTGSLNFTLMKNTKQKGWTTKVSPNCRYL